MKGDLLYQPHSFEHYPESMKQALIRLLLLIRYDSGGMLGLMLKHHDKLTKVLTQAIMKTFNTVLCAKAVV